MLPYLISGVLIVSGALVGLIAVQSNEFRVARSISIDAPPEQIFPHVNTMRSWEIWNPWDSLDPNMTIVYEGPESGVGASYTWSGNKEVGEGRSTIVASNPYESIEFRLDFLKPFKGTNDVEFTFDPQGDRTVVTWSMRGKKNFMFKAMGLIMDCDKMCGDMFNQGLASLKSNVEGTRVATAAMASHH